MKKFSLNRAPRLVQSAVLVSSMIGLFPISSPAANIQYGFSPEGSAQTLVLNVINSAQHDIRMMCYSFTSPKIVKALITAKRRGVDIEIVADKNGNRGKTNLAALNHVVHAGIALRLDDAYKIQHDKVIVVDGRTVETGSFNYTASAAQANSENVIVDWDDPKIAKGYLAHWQSRWDHAVDYHNEF